jgi:2,3-bisphosphoglycerate-independent phosphoglycerate mutase
MKRIIFFLIDGLADFPKDNTPLRSANKKINLNFLNYSHLSYIYPISKEYWPLKGKYSVSGLANFHLLGYKIKPEKFKRGPYEALGSNCYYKNGWLAFRANFSYVNDKLIVIDRRAGRNYLGLKKIAQEINEIKFEIPFIFCHTAGHRGVLIFKKKLSQEISDNDPYKNLKKVKKIRSTSNKKQAIKTADIINDFLNKLHFKLNNSKINKIRIKKNIPPANYLLIREGGNKLLKVKNFFRKYKLKNGVVCATSGVDKGICISLGFKKFDLDFPKDEKEEIKNIYEAVIKNYHSYQFIYLHLKKADEFSHDKLFQKKENFFVLLFKLLNKLVKIYKDDIFVISGDHITDTQSGLHRYGPVPLLIINSNLRNNPNEFSEKEAIKKGLFFKDNYLIWKFISKNAT